MCILHTSQYGPAACQVLNSQHSWWLPYWAVHILGTENRTPWQYRGVVLLHPLLKKKLPLGLLRTNRHNTATESETDSSKTVLHPPNH